MPHRVKYLPPAKLENGDHVTRAELNARLEPISEQLDRIEDAVTVLAKRDESERLLGPRGMVVAKWLGRTFVAVAMGTVGWAVSHFN